MRLVEVDPEHNRDCVMLFELLRERTPEQSISHRQMPSWDEHCAFVRSRPYEAWYLILSDDSLADRVLIVGACYLSKQREIGVQLFGAYQGQGYANEAVHELMRLHPGKFYANINPANERSIRFFSHLGFKHIQNTYILE